MRIQRGSRPLVEGDTNRAKELIVEGFSVLEGMYVVSYVFVSHVSHTSHIILTFIGCCPIDSVTPCLHVFVHYPDEAEDFGTLLWYALSAFERYNKKIKNMVGNSTHPIASLKSALLRDTGISLLLLPPLPPTFILSMCSGFIPTMESSPDYV